MKIFTVARSESAANDFVRRHQFIKNDIVVLLNESSLFNILNRIIEYEIEPVLFVHDDIYFNFDFVDRVNAAVKTLDNEYYGWGIAGNAGIACNELGFMASKKVRYISDPHGGPNLSGKIIPAESIDGNTMLLNVPLLKNKNVRLPHMEGFQLYDITLSIETVKAGLGVFILPHLLCFHSSGGNLQAFTRAVKSDSFKGYLDSTLKNNILMTINGDITIDSPQGELNFPEKALENCRRKYDDTSVAIIIRTQFKRNELLFRSILSIKSFIASSCNSHIFKCYIVTDDTSIDRDTYYDIPVICFRCDMQDSRFFLVYKSLSVINTDYIWFVDDDDWLFPNEAKILTDSILSFPKESTFYIGSGYFNEKNISYGNNSWKGNSRSEYVRFFNPQELLKSILGYNSIPFCGIIFPRKSILKKINDNIVTSITYYEDYYVELSNMFLYDFFPVIIDRLFVGISIRESGNTITERDRTKWNISCSSMFYHVVCNGGILFSCRDIKSINNNKDEKKIEFGIKEIYELKFFIKIKYLKYRIMAELTNGERRKHYQKKKKVYKNILKSINTNPF